MGWGNGRNKKGKDFYNSNSNYKEANPVTPDGWASGVPRCPLPITCTVPRQWGHVTVRHLFKSYLQLVPFTVDCQRENTTQYISSFNYSIPSKAIPKADHEMQAFIILLRHRSDYCPLWEESNNTHSSIHHWTWLCHFLLSDIEQRFWSRQLDVWGNDH